jgi:hypothetical protein
VELTIRFLKRKMQEYEALKTEIDAIQSQVVESVPVSADPTHQQTV